MQVSSQILRPLAGCDGCVQLLISKDIERLILRPLAGCDYSAEGNILLEDEETLISVPLRGVIRENDMWRVIDHEICSYVPLRGVIGKNEQK